MSIFDDNLKNTYVEGCLAELQRQIDNLTPVLDNSYVKFTPQALSTPEKEQARANIGAGAIIDNGVYLDEIAFGDSETIAYDITLGVLTFSLIEDYAKTDASNIDVDEFKTALDYTAEDITYDNTSSGLIATDVQNAIDEIVATMDDISASDISYDNTSSGLTATDVQAAIDELAQNSGNKPYTAKVELTRTADQSMIAGNNIIVMTNINRVDDPTNLINLNTSTGEISISNTVHYARLYGYLYNDGSIGDIDLRKNGSSVSDTFQRFSLSLINTGSNAHAAPFDTGFIPAPTNFFLNYYGSAASILSYFYSKIIVEVI